MIRVPPTKYCFPAESIRWILRKFREILEKGEYLTMGKYNEEFERKFAEYIGSKYAIAVNSGTAALEIVLRAINAKGYDIIVPTNTFAATAYAIIRAGARPILADVCNDLTLDPEEAKRKLTDKIKAIMTVHIGGLVSPKTYELLDLAQQRGIYLIEDAAQAHGSMLDNRKAGSFGIAAGFSFFPTKIITTGEGGMITTDDEEIYDKARIIRDQGKIGGMNYYAIGGYNWRMTEFQAIMGLAQLKYIEKFIERRTKIAKIYYEEFKSITALEPLEISENIRHNYYKFVVFIPNNRDREQLRTRLKEKFGVSLSGYVYEIPLHQQPIFKHYSSNLPVAEDLCNRHICPPIYPTMTEREAHYVSQSIKKTIESLGW